MNLKQQLALKMRARCRISIVLLKRLCAEPYGRRNYERHTISVDIAGPTHRPLVRATTLK